GSISAPISSIGAAVFSLDGGGACWACCDCLCRLGRKAINCSALVLYGRLCRGARLTSRWALSVCRAVVLDNIDSARPRPVRRRSIGHFQSTYQGSGGSRPRFRRRL